jgi:hypothetical protein
MYLGSGTGINFPGNAWRIPGKPGAFSQEFKPFFGGKKRTGRGGAGRAHINYDGSVSGRVYEPVNYFV